MIEETPTLPGLMMDWSKVADQLRKSANMKYELAEKAEGMLRGEPVTGAFPTDPQHAKDLWISADILSNIAYALQIGLGEK